MGSPVPPRPTVTIVTIGDELLIGDRTDTNARWMAGHLTGMGFEVVRIVSVGDEDSTIGAALQEAVERSDLVVATGGLGPTSDDRTREAVALSWGRDLTEDPEMLGVLTTWYGVDAPEDLTPARRRLARVPGGAHAIANPAGAAPALHLTLRGGGGDEERDLVLLPGVPGEMRALIEGPVGDVLTSRFGGRLRVEGSRLIRTTGIAESDLYRMVEEELGAPRLEVQVAYRPSWYGVELRLSSPALEAAEVLEQAEERLASILGPYRVDAPDGELAGAVGSELGRRGLRVAVAESCTAGLVLKLLTDVPGSSGWVLGGIVAYADRVKEELLGVPPEVLRKEGAVSEAVAERMASGVRERLGAEIGLAVTGIAGPAGGVPGKPVGTVCFGLSGSGGERSERIHFRGGRAEVRERSAQHALHLLLRNVAAPGRANPREG
jgi:nicotinamide-nucleotide amidase